MNQAVLGALSFRKDQHGSAHFQLLEDIAHPLDADAFLIDGYRAKSANQPAKHSVAEQRLAGQVTEVPPRRQADQIGIKITLMVGDEQSRPAFGNVVHTFGAQAEPQGHSRAGHPEEGLIPQIRKGVFHQ